MFDQIYVYEDGNLIDAQDLVVELPAGGGSIEKEFVTYGITEVRGVRNVEGISAEFLATCGYNHKTVIFKIDFPFQRLPSAGTSRTSRAARAARTAWSAALADGSVDGVRCECA